MKQSEYCELKTEMPEIAKIVELFPEALQMQVYQTMVRALAQGAIIAEIDDSMAVASDESPPTATSDVTPVDRRNYVTELLDYYSRYNLAKRSDMDVGVFVTYYYTFLAPEEKRVEEAGEEQFRDFCKVTGRKPPGHASTTLNNAKNRKGFLEQRGKGMYALSDLGEHYVKHTLLKEED